MSSNKTTVNKLITGRRRGRTRRKLMMMRRKKA